MKYILAIDQGTTGSTVSLMDSSGQIAAKADKDFRQIFPQAGWVEHDSRDIWQSVYESIHNVFQNCKISAQDIAAIGITNQRETVLAWDRKTGEPLMNAIVWQCRRTTEDCKKLKPQEKMIRKTTGLVLDPYFSASKMAWILKNVKGAKDLAKKDQLCFGTMDTFLIWKLTGGKTFKTDPSNASRTMLYDLRLQNYSDKLLQLFKIPKTSLAQIEPSDGDFGITRGVPGLPDGIPIRGVLGDQQAALFGQLALQKGDAKITFGTGSFLLFNTGNKIVVSPKGLLTTVAWGRKGQPMTYALEGGAFVCGAAVQWLRDGLGFIEKSSQVEELAQTVSDTEGVEFVPALTGLGAPYWNAQARGMIVGLTRGTTRAHVARATLEAMALQNVDILEAMKKDAKIQLSRVRVDGGATENNLLMQLQADYLGMGIDVPKNIETTSAGAAFMAGLGVGLWKSVREIEKVNGVDRKFKPQMSKKARVDRLVRWHRVIQSLLSLYKS